LKECPIAGFIAGKERNNFFDFGGAVTGEENSTALGFESVKLTLGVVFIEAIGDVVASKNIKDPGCPGRGIKTELRDTVDSLVGVCGIAVVADKIWFKMSICS
jgi:hypothetical protein